MGLPCVSHLGLLCTLILLVALPFAKTEEEVCCAGANRVEQPLGDFQGSEQLGRASTLGFCCVGCNLSYCCSSAEARLNQQLCSTLQAGPGDGKGVTQPLPTEPAFPGWIAFAIIMASGLAVCVYGCYNCYNWIWDWLLSRELERPGEWEGVAPPGVTSFCPTLPAYVRMHPPVYSAEDPEDARSVPPMPVPPAPVVQFQHLFSRNPEDEAVPCSSAVSDSSLVPCLEMEISV